MKRILFALVLATQAGLAELPADWKNVQRLVVVEPGLIKLNLPVETLAGTRPALEDLRVYDAATHEVPYLIERPTRTEAVSRAGKNFAVTLKLQETVITLDTGSAQTIEGVTLATAASSFIKAAKVEGWAGDDWKTLATGQPIFRQPSGATKLQIKLSPGTYRTLRVTVDDRRSEPVPFTGATVLGAAQEAVTEPLPANITERAESDGDTRLTVDLGAANVTVASLQIETDEPLFMREVEIAVRQLSEAGLSEQTLTRGTIYRVAVEGAATTAELRIPVELPVPMRELQVIIHNRDNPALPVAAIHVQRRPVYAVFNARAAGEYQLLTGNARCEPPRYDLAALAGNLQGAAVSPLQLSALAGNPAYRPGEVLPEIENLGSKLDVSEWRYRKPVLLNRAGVQQLELDLETLAHADPAWRDLRLVRDGQQRPYVLERTSIQRKLALPAQSANDPQRPRLSRWELRLPQARLPVTRLTCTTPTVLFRRDLRLLEQPTDERGEKYDRSLGNASWERTPPASARRLEMVLTSAPVTDTLILETDNGDNPPIQLENFAAWYPAARVWFKALPEPPTFLYYGNARAGAPQYDIALVAPRLLAAEKSIATLAKEEALKPAGWAERAGAPRSRNVIFWVALGAVVVVLLVVIGRLLPKQP